MIPVRATVVVGGLSVSTPYVLSFNVNKTRGQISTCSASLKVGNSELTNQVGGYITVSAGRRGSENLIYTGIVRSSNITPCRDDPAYVILTVTAQDVLSELQGKKYTRRCRSINSVWVEITGVQRPGLKSGKFAYLPNDEYFETDGIDVQSKRAVTATKVKDVADAAEVPTAGDQPSVRMEWSFSEPEAPSGT